jgi:hypothetical protein
LLYTQVDELPSWRHGVTAIWSLVTVIVCLDPMSASRHSVGASDYVVV